VVGKDLVDLIVNGSFETGDFAGWDASQINYWYLKRNGAYDGAYYIRFGANRYEMAIDQTLPYAPEEYIYSFAFRVGSRLGEMEAWGICGFNWYPQLYVKENNNGTFPITIRGSAGGKWNGVLYGSEVGDGYWLTDWHLLTMKRSGGSVDFYLDGSWIFKDDLPLSDRIVVSASGGTTSILSGFFDFDYIQLFAKGIEHIANGGFEAGALEPWRPSLSAYAYCTHLTADAYEGNYCLHTGPTRYSHGAVACGAEQDITRVAAPYRFVCAFKKLDPYLPDNVWFEFGERIWLACDAATNGQIPFTAYRGVPYGTPIGSGVIGKGWNIFEAVARESEYDIVVNGVKIATVPVALTCNLVSMGTSWRLAPDGGSYLFDAVSLIK
jgi:hypothetical protein